MPSTSCKFCKAKIVWFKTPDGKKLPVYPEPREDGSLIVDVDGKLVKLVSFFNWRELSQHVKKYRSHLLDCKPLARSLHLPVIKLGISQPFQCNNSDCELETDHVHCFKCGEVGHYADACETETDGLKELA